MWSLPLLHNIDSSEPDMDEKQLREIVQGVISQVMGKPEVGNSHTSDLPGSPMTTTPSTTPATTSRLNVKPRKIVALGTDHGGFELKESLKATLSELGFDVNDVGTHSKAAVDYPDYAHEVAKLVATGKAWRGIMIDGAGIGSCIVANKVPGIRAGMAYDLSSAINSREHNDTNVLTLGAGMVGINLVKQIVKTWLTTEFGGERHLRRIEKITAVEHEYRK